MSEANKAIIRRFLEEVFGQGRLEVVDEIYTPDHVLHSSTQDSYGPESVKQVIATNRSAFPDLQVISEAIIAEADKVVSRHTLRGTHQGEWLGIAPTHLQVVRTVHVIFRLVGGRIAESWVVSDRLGALQQIGIYR